MHSEAIPSPFAEAKQASALAFHPADHCFDLSAIDFAALLSEMGSAEPGWLDDAERAWPAGHPEWALEGLEAILAPLL